jgi:FkbM family methyltransferase
MPDSQTRKILLDTINLISDDCEQIKKFPVYSSDIYPNKILGLLNRGLSIIGSQVLIVPEKNKEVITESIQLFKLLDEKWSDFDRVREMFYDDYSKNIFNWVLKYRLAYAFIGGQALYLFDPPISTAEYRRIRKAANKFKHHGVYYLEGYKIAAHSGIIETNWLLKQYKYEPYCVPEQNDTIFDIGACTGETSVWFASEIKRKGHIYSFEPDDVNYNNLEKNIRMNQLDDCITPVHYGLWESNLKLQFSNPGGGNTINAEGEKLSEVIKFDDFIEDKKIDNVDYVKMDIEGAEMGALKGASETIKREKPKLAISVYHKASDLVDIPLYLKSLVPEYRFYMKHVTTNFGETVLFATTKH